MMHCDCGSLCISLKNQHLNWKYLDFQILQQITNNVVLMQSAHCPGLVAEMCYSESIIIIIDLVQVS